MLNICNIGKIYASEPFEMKPTVQVWYDTKGQRQGLLEKQHLKNEPRLNLR